MLPRIDYSVVVPVPAELACRAFSNLERLLHRGIYEEISWVEGSPWQVGSRIRYMVSQPVRTTISAVVTSYEPPRFVALLNHAMGVTAEQQVTFAGALNRGTTVRMIVDFVGKSPDLPEDQIRQAILVYTRDALDTIAPLCEKWKAVGSSG